MLKRIPVCRAHNEIQAWFETRRVLERIIPDSLFQTLCDNRIVYLRPDAGQAIKTWTDETFKQLLSTHGQKRRILWGADWLLDNV